MDRTRELRISCEVPSVALGGVLHGGFSGGNMLTIM